MITFSGIHIQKIGGADGTPIPIDVAVQSGRICRFGGALWYPLLTHLVFVGLLAYRRSGSIPNLIWGFLHDAHEVATSDVPRPFKCDCMRVEQKAIDQRILSEWFAPTFYQQIDFDLIQKCDVDACDIEAVVLNLPNYAKVVSKCGQEYGKYRKWVHDDAEETELFQRLLKSQFYGDTHHETNKGVGDFAHLLLKARLGHWDDVRFNVERWGLLDSPAEMEAAA